MSTGPNEARGIMSDGDPESWGRTPERFFPAPPDSVSCPHCEGKGYLTPATATVGDMIALRRKLLGLTQQELAATVGVSRPQVANIESGRHDPPVSAIRRYADALKCNVKDLIP